jgi:GTP-binding protein HflX
MIEKKNIINRNSQERIVLVGLVLKNSSKAAQNILHLKELAFLCKTAGGETIATFIQQRLKPSPATFLGKGKLLEIRDFIIENKIDTTVFDDNLSPSQQKNIEEILKVKVIDRTSLILDIFASHAKTAHARVQVELAQYQYLLPRLTRMWTHLERQQGGIGVRGPGEKEIETDRRIIRDKISKLKKRLIIIDRQKATQRMNRGKLVRVALVGYTNAGKSTLLNLLAKTNVTVENKLFATLDTKVKKVVIKNLPFLLSDTVGFILKLPHCLVNSFKATLDEVREADILLHVIDASHQQVDEQIRVVKKTLNELGVKDKLILNIYNKIDRIAEKSADALFFESEEGNVGISARDNTNTSRLKELLYTNIKKIHLIRYPYNDFLYSDEFIKKS